VDSQYRFLSFLCKQSTDNPAMNDSVKRMEQLGAEYFSVGDDFQELVRKERGASAVEDYGVQGRICEYMRESLEARAGSSCA